jgi:hypothetical protein
MTKGKSHVKREVGRAPYLTFRGYELICQLKIVNVRSFGISQGFTFRPPVHIPRELLSYDSNHVSQCSGRVCVRDRKLSV